jgi:hypothetical protein
VVASAREPFTDRPMHGVERILDWLQAWAVPWRWPAGRPAPVAQARTTERRQALWALGGHFGASQIPDWDAAGPGHIDIDLLGMSGPTFCQGLARRRKTRPSMVNRNHRTARESMLGPKTKTGAAVASLANAPY